MREDADVEVGAENDNGATVLFSTSEGVNRHGHQDLNKESRIPKVNCTCKLITSYTTVTYADSQLSHS